MKIFITVLVTMFSFSALADYTMVIPQKPGSGTSQWASIVAKHMEKHLDEKIVLKHIPGARDIPGFNKFHNELRFDDKTIMVSHGGNAVGFLTEKVDYNYNEYSAIGGMNLTIVMGSKDLKDKAVFAGGSGNVPDAMALTLYMCGHMTMEEYKKCFDEKITFVKGMKPGERRLAFKRGELNITRENPAAYKKHAKGVEVLFTHGVYNINKYMQVDDPNHPGKLFDMVYYMKWGHHPTSDLFYAYDLVRTYRDTLQKVFWVNKGNPNTDKLRSALEKMLKDKEAIKDITKKVGVYDWFVGSDYTLMLSILNHIKTDKALKNLVNFQKEVLGYDAVLK